MENTDKTQVAKDWILKLANGINPLDGTPIKDDDIVNNVHVSRCLFYVSELIENVIQKKGKISREYSLAFSITPENLSKVYISDKTGIANFVKEINKFVPENMKPLSNSVILNWLLANGYLETVKKEDGGKTRRPTNLGMSIGISTEMRDGVNGQYVAVEYNANAQRYILDNLYTIIGA